MLKRIIAASLALALSGALGYAASIQITGTNSASKNQIFQMGIPRITRDEGITATPSGSITTSYQLTAGLNQVVTIASTGDGVKLPITTGPSGGTAGGGLLIIVNNAHASNAVNIFPNQAADTINAITAGGAFSLTAGKTAMFIVTADGKWVTLPLAP